MHAVNMITVSEDALDSIKRMGEADRARIEELSDALRFIWWCAPMATRTASTWHEVCKKIAEVRVNTDINPAAKGEN
jgi:hypothetical protein